MRLRGALFIGLLVAPFLVTTVYLHTKRAMIRSEVKHRLMESIDESELVRLSFTEKEAASLNWKHSKEFEFEGHMYDIVRTEQEGSHTTYICWPDHDESKVNRSLAALTDGLLNSSSEKQRSQQFIAQFARTLFLSPPFDWSAFVNDGAFVHYTDLSTSLLNGYYTVDTPPPNCLHTPSS